LSLRCFFSSACCCCVGRASWTRNSPLLAFTYLIQRRLFLADVTVINTPEEQNAVYLELLYNVVSGALPVINEVTANSLVALSLWAKTIQANLPLSNETTAITNGMMDLVPGPWYTTKTEADWAAQVKKDFFVFLIGRRLTFKTIIKVVRIGQAIRDTNPLVLFFFSQLFGCRLILKLPFDKNNIGMS